MNNIASVNKVLSVPELLSKVISHLSPYHKSKARGISWKWEVEANYQLNRPGQQVKFGRRNWLGLAKPYFLQDSREVCDYKLTSFGKWAQLDQYDIYVLNEPNRSLLSRLSDVLLLDPISRAIGKEMLLGDFRDGNEVNNLHIIRLQLLYSKIAIIFHAYLIFLGKDSISSLSNYYGLWDFAVNYMIGITIIRFFSFLIEIYLSNNIKPD